MQWLSRGCAGSCGRAQLTHRPSWRVDMRGIEGSLGLSVREGGSLTTGAVLGKM